MAKKKTENQKQFQKQRARLLAAVRRGEKRGFVFEGDLVPDMPKRVTKQAIERIKKIKPSDLYKKAVFTEPSTGIVIPALQRVKEERQISARKASETRKAKKAKSTAIPKTFYPTLSNIDSIMALLKDLTRESKPPVNIEARKNALVAIFEDTLTYYEEDLEQLEEYLIEHENEIIEALNVIAYDSDSEKISVSFAQVGRLLNVQPLSMSQAESLSHFAEYYSE